MEQKKDTYTTESLKEKTYDNIEDLVEDAMNYGICPSENIYKNGIITGDQIIHYLIP